MSKITELLEHVMKRREQRRPSRAAPQVAGLGAGAGRPQPVDVEQPLPAAGPRPGHGGCHARLLLRGEGTISRNKGFFFSLQIFLKFEANVCKILIQETF